MRTSLTIIAFIVIAVFVVDVMTIHRVAKAQQQWRPVVLMHGLLATSEAMSHAQQWYAIKRRRRRRRRD
jgi:hypothetical protein